MASINEQLRQAWIFLQQERTADALRLAQAVIAVEPENISARACRAMAIAGPTGHSAEAIAELGWAVGRAPAVSQLRHNLALMLSRAGDVDGAAEQFREALRLAPDDAVAFYGYASNHRMREEALLAAEMEALFEAGSLSAGERRHLAFGLAKTFDDLDDPAKAMRYAFAAHNLEAGHWNAAGAEAMVAALGESAAADAFRKARTSGHPTRAPLFIVGMPRSGTTLIETILSRHPDVLPLGESRQIPDSLEAARRAAGAPDRLDASLGLGRDWLKARAETLVRSWSAKRGPRGLVTDKMPDNAFSLGLIQQLLPHARVIHVRRHPLDVGVSNFLTFFAEAPPFETRLDWLGQRIRHVESVMELWKRVLDLPILTVQYEHLVADPEPQIRRIAAFAGLDWRDDFLTPEQARRNVQTASEWQVRQPIYRTSVARWKRYAAWLGPMIEAMGGMDWVESHGPAGLDAPRLT